MEAKIYDRCLTLLMRVATFLFLTDFSPRNRSNDKPNLTCPIILVLHFVHN